MSLRSKTKSAVSKAGLSIQSVKCLFSFPAWIVSSQENIDLGDDICSVLGTGSSAFWVLLKGKPVPVG